jgi:hypothetical protein
LSYRSFTYLLESFNLVPQVISNLKMPPYQYSKLSQEAQDIRIVALLPGQFEDDIRFTLLRTPLIPREDHPRQRISLADLKKTVPPGWTIYENLEGRFIFENDETESTSWTHPIPSFDRSLYDPPADDSQPEFEPRYEALSYTWGSPENTETVFVEPTETKLPRPTATTLQIGRSLSTALRHLRCPDTTRMMWIDAVCINQADEAERSVQVKRMSYIYKLAYRVVVWLGSRRDSSDLALSTLRYLGDQVEYSRNGFHVRHPEATESYWFRFTYTLPYHEETWRALHELLKRSWFQRLWILQEVQLASFLTVIQCGHDQIPWPIFRRALMCLKFKKYVPTLQLRETFKFTSLIALDNLNYPIYTLLLAIRRQKCSDPRDKIYGLLGVASPMFAKEIHPKYSSPAGEVYKDALLADFNHTKRLELLQSCSLVERLIDSPSWVADWSFPRTLHPLFYSAQFASGASYAEANYISPHTLEVTGVRCAIVSTVRQPARPRDANEIPAAIRKWEPENLRTNFYVTGETLLDAFAYSLCCFHIKERHIDNCGAATFREWKEWLITEILDAATPVGKKANFDYRWPLGWTKERTFLETEEGFIGIGPADTQPGKYDLCHSSIIRKLTQQQVISYALFLVALRH